MSIRVRIKAIDRPEELPVMSSEYVTVSPVSIRVDIGGRAISVIALDLNDLEYVYFINPLIEVGRSMMVKSELGVLYAFPTGNYSDIVLTESKNLGRVKIIDIQR